jgi:hypothetical protein
MVDPFGFKGVPFELIARAAKQPKSEFLISFMYEPVARFTSHPNAEVLKHFDILFGCPDWRKAEGMNSTDRRAFLVGLYLDQLRSAGLTYVRAFEMIDDGSRTEYFLIFGTHSLDGLRAMKAAMWKADPSGKYQFSDASATGQLTLIAPKPDFDELKKLIVSRFQGSDFTMPQLEEFVLVDTPFRESHYKREILKPMEKAKELEVIKSPRKMKFTYPDGTIIRLPPVGN